MIHLALIERDPSDDVEVIAGPTWHAVARAAASRVMDREVTGPPSDWRTVDDELPLTREVLDDEDKLRDWHEAFREGVTQPWVSFYELPWFDPGHVPGTGVRWAVPHKD